MIWLDVLNVPLVEALDATIFEFDYASPDSNLPPHRQVITERAGHSTRLYSTGGLKPLFVRSNDLDRVCTRLSAGGKQIRTAGPTSTETLFGIAFL